MEQAFCWIKLTLPGSGSWGVLLTRGEKGQFCVFWCLISCTGSLPMPTECLATRGAKPWPVPILPYQHTHIAITSYSSCLWRRDHHSQNYQMVEHGPHRGQARVAAVCQSRMLLVGEKETLHVMHGHTGTALDNKLNSWDCERQALQDYKGEVASAPWVDVLGLLEFQKFTGKWSQWFGDWAVWGQLSELTWTSLSGHISTEWGAQFWV